MSPIEIGSLWIRLYCLNLALCELVCIAWTYWVSTYSIGTYKNLLSKYLLNIFRELMLMLDGLRVKLCHSLLHNKEPSLEILYVLSFSVEIYLIPGHLFYQSVHTG